MRNASLLLSVLFHPLLVVLYAYALLFALGTYHAYLPVAVKRVVLFILLIDTVLIPLLLLLLLRHMGMVSSIELPQPRERLAPLALTVLAYIIALFLLRRLGLSVLLLKLLLGGTLVLMAALGISAWWKVSCHAMGIGGLTGFLFWCALSGIMRTSAPLFVAVALSGLLLSARLHLGAHRPAQVYAGYLIGMGITLILFML